MNVNYILDKYNELKLYEDYYNYKYEPLKLKGKELKNFLKQHINNNSNNNDNFNHEEEKNTKQESTSDIILNPIIKTRSINNRLLNAKIKHFSDPITAPFFKSPYFFPWKIESKNQLIKDTILFPSKHKLVNSWEKIKSFWNENYNDNNDEYFNENNDEYEIDNLLNDNTNTEENNSLHHKKNNNLYHLCEKLKIEKLKKGILNENKKNKIETFLTSDGLYPFSNFKKFTKSILNAVNNQKKLPIINSSNPTIYTNGTKEEISDNFTLQKYRTQNLFYKPKIDMTSDATKYSAQIKYIEIDRKNFDITNLYSISKPLIPTIRGKIAKNMKKRYKKPIRVIENLIENK